MSVIKPLCILLAEDNEDHAELMVDTLAEFNVKNVIVHVNNGEQVLQYLLQQPPFDDASLMVPDLILLDLKMPRMDGISTLKMIKSDSGLKHLPVIIVSTSATENEINQCYSLGANSYITKPLQFEDFSKKVRDLNLYWVLTTELPSNLQ